MTGKFPIKLFSATKEAGSPAQSVLETLHDVGNCRDPDPGGAKGNSANVAGCAALRATPEEAPIKKIYCCKLTRGITGGGLARNPACCGVA